MTLFSVFLSIAIAGPDWAAQFEARDPVGDAWNLQTGEVNAAAIEKWTRKKWITGYEESPGRMHWTLDRDKTRLKSITVFADSAGNPLGVSAGLGAYIDNTQRKAFAGSGDQEHSVPIERAVWTGNWHEMWWTSPTPGLYHADDYMLWAWDPGAFEVMGGVSVDARIRALEEAWEAHDVRAGLDALYLMDRNFGGDFAEWYFGALVQPRYAELVSGSFDGPDALARLEWTALFKLIKARFELDSDQLDPPPWEVMGEFNARRSAASERLLAEAQADGRHGTALAIRALEHMANDPGGVLGYAPSRGLGDPYDDDAVGETERLILRAAAGVVDALDPQSVLTHELYVASDYGQSDGLAVLRTRMSGAYGAWAAATGQPVVTVEVDWNQDLRVALGEETRECAQHMRVDDMDEFWERADAWAEKEASLRADAENETRLAPNLPDEIRAPHVPYGGTIERQYTKTWIQGDSVWTEKGIETVDRTSIIIEGGAPFRWKGKRDKGGSARSRLNNHLAYKPWGVRAKDEVQTSSYRYTEQVWTGSVTRTLKLGSLGDFERTANIAEVRTSVDGPACVMRRNELVSREGFLEQVEVNLLNGEVIDALEKRTREHIDAVTGDGWTTEETDWERAALAWMFLPSDRGVPARPFDDAFGAGISDKGKTVLLPGDVNIYRHELRTERPLYRYHPGDTYADKRLGAVSLDGRFAAVVANESLRIHDYTDAYGDEVARHEIANIERIVWMPDQQLAMRVDGSWRAWNLMEGTFAEMDGPPTFEVAGRTFAWDDDDALTVTLEDGTTRYFRHPAGVTETGWVLYSLYDNRSSPSRVWIEDF